LKKLILLVDDSRDDALAIQQTLKVAGVGNPVVVLEDGDDAIAYLKGEGRYSDRNSAPVPRVLLLDLRMPRVDGFEVLEWIRKHAVYRDLLIVVVSGNSALDNIKKCYSLGANSVLMKPTSEKDIRILKKSFPEYWLPTFTTLPPEL
jgi:CheY-like chemotaxis protein